MKNKSLVSMVILLLVSSMVLTACLSSSQTQSSDDSAAATERELKDGDTTLTGVISKTGTVFYITDTAGKTQDIDSYAVELDEYVGQTVTVTGQFSGTTLFVGKIE